MNDLKNWFGLRISVSPENLGIVANFCFENGCLGLEEQEDGILAYFSGESPSKKLEESFQTYLSNLKANGLTVGELQWISVPDEDWGRTWQQFFKPIHMTPGIVVKPPWEIWTPSSEIVIDIMPKMAFGTGTHETTQLCAELLEENMKPSSTVLDVGSGSGILSILAIKLGAQKALGLDVDPACMDNGKENGVLNHVGSQIDFHLGPLETLSNHPFDFILANINWLTLEQIIPSLSAFCKEDSIIILSGVLAEKVGLFKTCCADSNLEILEIRQKQEWIGALARPLSD